ncbi:MAG: ComEC family competence protein [Alphaproteobacteria bacterium]|nr:ComEC family competence protein [Alphaproteobacteria bacterium]
MAHAHQGLRARLRALIARAARLPRALGLAALDRALSAERERWALWAPALFGVGIAFYFALPIEPPPGVAAALGLTAAGALWLARRARSALLLLTLAGLAVAAAGVEWTVWRTIGAERPTLARDAGAVRLAGLVTKVEAFESGPRVTLRGTDYLWRAPDPAPETVRVRLRAGERVTIGERIELTAVLRPPPRPAYPGGYDFARRAWFEGLGAVGFALSAVERAPQEASAPADWRIALGAAVDGWRQRVTRRIRAALPGEPGDVAAALITGDRSGLDSESVEAMRQSGLAHLLAISGLHIGLAAGVVFFGLRAVLAAVEPVALRWPIKKWAAAAGLLAAFVYLLLAGGTVPTQRAFLMTGLVLLAVMLDRKAISLRLVAIAAALVLMWRPEALIGASFQLSFAAVVALVAVYESWRPVKREEGARNLEGWERRGRRVLLYLLLIVSTTLIAGAATAPFALHHFGRVANYGVLANLAGIPLVAWVVAPAGVAAMLAMPFGLEAGPFAVMGLGIEAVLGVAHWTAALPGSVLHLPATPAWAAALVAGGGVWAAIWRGRWRYWGAAPVALGLVAPLLAPAPPKVIVSETGRLAAVAGSGEALWLSAPRRERFAAGVWSERTGRPIAGGWDDLIAERGAGSGPLSCGPLGCLYRIEGRAIAFSYDPRTLAEDCRAADVVVATVVIPDALREGACAGRLLIDPVERAVRGTHVATWGAAGVRLQTVEAARGARPWSRAR